MRYGSHRLFKDDLFGESQYRTDARLQLDGRNCSLFLSTPFRFLCGPNSRKQKQRTYLQLVENDYKDTGWNSVSWQTQYTKGVFANS